MPNNIDSQREHLQYSPCVTALPPQGPTEPVLPFQFGSNLPYSLAPIAFSHYVPPTIDTVPTEHRPVGRPKGSKNRKKGSTETPKPTRRPGRPKGSVKRPREESDGDEPPPKRHPGRPRKNAAKVAETQVEFGRFIIPRVSGTSFLPSAARPPSHNDAATSTLSCLPRVPTPPDSSTTATHVEPPISFEPGEDPQQALCWDDDVRVRDEGDDEESEEGDGIDCFEDEAEGEGIGIDEEGCGDGADDEPDPVEIAPENGEPLASASKRNALPQWLLDAFGVCLTAAKDRNAEGLPRLYYEGHTFWFPTTSAWFLLARSRQPSPELLYQPRFFLWDPLAITPIPCPYCKMPLVRHGNIARPRRCVDHRSTFWIIGYRYRCSTCRNAKSGRRTVTFCSWDSRILARLPPGLADEFPAILTWRSGISKGVFEWMRACFQRGMGAKQFSDCLRTLHVLEHEEREVQYLRFLASRPLDQWVGKTYASFPAYDDSGPTGPHGYVPSAQVFRNVYDYEIGVKRRPEITQHTSMLSLKTGALDHSHKFNKHIARVNGERVFAGLLTVTNENGEIRTCHLVTTTGHSQSVLALSELSHSLERYGHDQPNVLFTDNVAGDRNLLESVFHSSLRKDVIRIEDYAHLEELRIPAGISIAVKNTISGINLACQSIMDNLAEKELVIGFDSEWNVDFSANGRIQHRGPTAIVQIAFQDQIFIFQVGDMLANNCLPSQLRVLLENPKILKVGRLIDADLKNLQSLSHSRNPFLGAVDLAKLAKQRCVLDKIKTASLASLAARVLHKRLNKNVSERISSAWESPVLTQEQITYAALDAYASLRIYEVLDSLKPPGQVLESMTLEIGTPVLLRSSDNKSIIASGKISEAPPGLVLQKGSIPILVHEIIRGAAKLKMHQDRPLSDFGHPPFTVVHLKSQLLLYDPLPQPPAQPQLSQSVQRLPPLQPEMDCSSSHVGMPALSLEATEGREIDPASAAAGGQELGPQPISWPAPTVRSRVIKDAFHLMNMFNLSKQHGIRDDFYRALRDAIFIPDTQDANRIAVWGSAQIPPVTFNQLRRYKPTWLWKRCKRFIPPPEILYPRVYKVLQTFGPLKDASTGAPLFDLTRWKTAKSVLDLIYNGNLSDPPGVPLYTTLGLDKKTNLPLYRCFRGTNMTEGGVHTHLRPHLPTSGSSLQHVEAALMDFVLYHNLTVGTMNTTGLRYRGHFSIWLTNEIQELRLYLKDTLVGPQTPDPPWVNGNLYQQTTEVPIGVLPVPKDVRDTNGLGEYIEGLNQRQAYDYLAKRQGTRKAILPVHTPSERALFRNFMQKSSFSNLSTPDWKHEVKVWNGYADSNPDIHYKLTEQLQSYFSHWKSTLNTKESLSMTETARLPLIHELTDLSRTLDAPPVPDRDLQPHLANRGLATATPPIQSDAVSLTNNSGADIAPPTPPSTSVPSQPTQQSIVHQRIAAAQDQCKAKKKPRQPRHCAKCGQLLCPGRQTRRNCKNQCKHCLQHACKGPNPARPSRRCHEAWD